jgi:hypothetical protein
MSLIAIKLPKEAGDDVSKELENEDDAARRFRLFAGGDRFEQYTKEIIKTILYVTHFHFDVSFKGFHGFCTSMSLRAAGPKAP